MSKISEMLRTKAAAFEKQAQEVEASSRLALIKEAALSALTAKGIKLPEDQVNAVINQMLEQK